MQYRIEFLPEAAEDYRQLDGSIKKDIAKKIDALAENPFLGFPLGNVHNTDLNGFYKLYAASKKIRIVYRLLGDNIVEVIEIWGIGRREKEEIYRTIAQRIKRKK